MSLPPLFESRMRRLLGTEYAAFFDAWNRPLITRGIRANTLKLSADALWQLLPFEVTAVSFSPTGGVTTAGFRAGSDPLHHAGAYYMQEPSAMSAVTVLAPTPGERVLDLCAAPGGKSTQIAAALQGNGLLWANEYVPARARILLQNMERLGVRNGVVSCGDTARLAENLPNWFNAVLADVPCSGEGMFRKEPDAIPDWSEDTIRLCAERSHGILDNAARCVRPGGRLVISTCTFAPEENECAVIRFLHDHPDFTLHRIDVPFGRPAFDADNILSFLEPELHDFAKTVDTACCRRIFPCDGGEGHFIALLHREGNSAVPVTPFVPPRKDTTAPLGQSLYADCFTDTPNGTFATFGNTVHLLPPLFPATRGINILSAGIPVAELCGERTLRAEPCHGAFQAATANSCRRVLSLELTDPRLTAFLRGEEIATNTPAGFTGVAVNGILTGFGKVSGTKLKNHYPKSLRLLK
ncbi:MAG: hypothetical protein IKU56_01185 [Clostridia bacterium]|nr:hypothetical protein [Clostridia bacterium]